MDSLRQNTVRGAAWSLASFGGTRILLLLNIVVLARLLEPSDFGLLAAASLALGAVGFLGELGLGGAFVLRQDLDHRAQGTVLSLMLVAGGLAAGVVAALSPLAASVFGEPRVAPLLAVLSTKLLVNGFTWFYEQVFLRSLQFRHRFLTMVAQGVATLVVGVGSALLGAGVWSLVAGELAGMVARGMAQLLLAPYRVRPRWDGKVVREMVSAGRGFMALGGLTFARQNLDYLAVARVLGSGPLGFYSMAYRLAELPATAIAGSIAKVTFPTFARMRAHEEDVSAPFLRTLRSVALVTAPMGLVLSACSEPLVVVVFGEEWRPMIGALTLLGLWAVLRPVQWTCGSFLEGLGRAGSTAVLVALSVAFLGPATFVAARSGIVAVAWVLVAEAVVALGLYMLTIGRFGVSVRAQAWVLWPVAVASTLAWLAAFGTQRLATDLPMHVVLLLSVVTLICVYAAVIAMVSPSTMRDALAAIRGLVRRSGGDGEKAKDQPVKVL